MVKNWCNVLSMEGVTVCGHHPECRVTFGRGDLILFGKIPVPTIELSEFYHRRIYWGVSFVIYFILLMFKCLDWLP